MCEFTTLLVLMMLCQLALLAYQAQLCPSPTTGWWWRRPFSSAQPWCTQVLVAVLEKGLIPSLCVTFTPGCKLCSIPVKLKLLLKICESEWIHALGMKSLSSKVSFILWWLVFWLVLDVSLNFSFFFYTLLLRSNVASGFWANGTEAVIVWFSGGGFETTEVFGLC